jgi:hypothetical protein
MARRIFGSSLAALVAVLELSKSEEVVWVQTGPRVAGHFMGIQILETNVDLGMVALETHNAGSNQRTFTEVLPIRQAGIPFVHLGFEWLKALGEEFQEIPVSISILGKNLPDFLIADDLSIMRFLDLDTRQVILSQIQNILEGAELETLHPKNKNLSEVFIDLSLRDVLTATVGVQFYESLIQPWFHKFNSKLPDFLPARDHRTAWVPMFYPETIKNALIEVGPVNHLSRAFVVPKNSSVAALVSRLTNKVDKSRVTLQTLDDFTEPPSSGDIILTNTSEVMNLFSQEYEGAYSSQFEISITVVVLLYNEVVSQDFILNVADDTDGAYRICSRKITSEGDKSVVTLEFGEGFENTSDEEIMAIGRPLLDKLGIPITYVSNMLKRVKLKVPYGLSREKVELDRHSAHQLMIANKIFGFPIDFGSSAFNDQVLLGLWSANAARSSE